MTESQIKSVALFFYFTLLDEEFAEKATRLTIESCQKVFKKNPPAEEEMMIFIVKKMNSIFERIRSEQLLIKPVLNRKPSHFFLPEISFGAWRQFHKEATVEELVAVVCSQILNLNDTTISKGLDITVGSVRYRVGIGLRQLGKLITLGEIIA